MAGDSQQQRWHFGENRIFSVLMMSGWKERHPEGCRLRRKGAAMVGWACCYESPAWPPGAPPLCPGAAPGLVSSSPQPCHGWLGVPQARPAHAPHPGLAFPYPRKCLIPGDKPALLFPISRASPAPVVMWCPSVLLLEEQYMLRGKWKLYSRFHFWWQGQELEPLSGNRLLALVTVTVTAVCFAYE